MTEEKKTIANSNRNFVLLQVIVGFLVIGGIDLCLLVYLEGDYLVPALFTLCAAPVPPIVAYYGVRSSSWLAANGVCPECRAPGLEAFSVQGYTGVTVYKCNKCGMEGKMIVPALLGRVRE